MNNHKRGIYHKIEIQGKRGSNFVHSKTKKKERIVALVLTPLTYVVSFAFQLNILAEWIDISMFSFGNKNQK